MTNQPDTFSGPPRELGGDCEWYAVDSSGQIGFFTSAGEGDLPELYWPIPTMLGELAETVAQMPEICGHEFVAERRSGDYRSWTDAADKGMYGYDYDLYEKRGYMLMTIPGRPLRIGDAVAAWACVLPRYEGVFGRGSMAISSSSVLKWRPRLR